MKAEVIKKDNVYTKRKQEINSRRISSEKVVVDKVAVHAVVVDMFIEEVKAVT